MKKFSVFAVVTLSVWGAVGLQGCRPKDDQQVNNADINQLDARDYSQGREAEEFTELTKAWSFIVEADENGCIRRSQYDFFDENSYKCEGLTYSFQDVRSEKYAGTRRKWRVSGWVIIDASACAKFVGAFNALEETMKKCLANKKKEAQDKFFRDMANFVPNQIKHFVDAQKRQKLERGQKLKSEQELNAEAAKAATEIQRL